MNQKQLVRMYTGKGFIAALDQSGGSSPKALLNYGITPDSYASEEEMYQLIHNMRTRIIKSPSFSSAHILGAILFENTMDRMIDDVYTADYLWEQKNIIPFLKIDKGLLPEKNGVQLMKDIPNLDLLLQKAASRNIFGTKMRSVIKSAIPSGIKAIVSQQFELGRTIADYGFVPILEPEVDIFAPDKANAEDLLKQEILTQLALPANDYKMILKLSIPTQDNLYAELMDDPHILRVVALSGGYSKEEAAIKLTANHGLIASFSRALLEDLSIKQSAADFNQTLAENIHVIYTASIS